MICGLLEFCDLLFLLNFLRKKDLFVDINANIGSYIILTSTHVEEDIISIESIPSIFQQFD